jgi:hypothetical protein
LFGPDGITELARADATTHRVREEATRHLYLHLATHGFFAEEQYESALSRPARDAFMAEELVRSQGVDGLIEAGMLDDGLEMQNESQWSAAGHGWFLGATFSCILAGE